MINVVCSVFDSKAKAFMQPFFSTNLPVAIRAFTGAANTPGTPIGDHPADFVLFHLGSFDDQLGQFNLLSAPENLGLAANFKKEK